MAAPGPYNPLRMAGPRNDIMKYAIIIPDGCADEPQTALGGKTPLQAAHTPNMDRIARTGVVGRTDNVPPSLTPASDVATLSLFGYDPLVVYTGRAPLETAAMGIPLGPNDWAVRCNLVTVENGLMRDFTAQHISSEEARTLIADLHSALGGAKESGVRLEFHPGVQYRNILVCRCGPVAPFSTETKTQPPHDIPDRPVADHLPRGPGSELLIGLMESSKSILADHPINKARRAAGKRPATQVWLWGQGRAPSLRPFAEVYGKRGAILSAVDLVRGVGVLLGWKRIDVPGATGYLDTDYAAKGRYGVAALADHDLVCVHIEAPDEASHEGRADEKVKALEQIDRHIVGPLLEALPSYGEWRILVSPDHRTTLSTRAHAYGMVPFALAGTGVAAHGQSSYDEAVAAASDLVFALGHKLMQRFLS
jgi:2,3-bisphosphoglycerate-independent phosphoglycerate mutase